MATVLEGAAVATLRGASDTVDTFACASSGTT